MVIRGEGRAVFAAASSLSNSVWLEANQDGCSQERRSAVRPNRLPPGHNLSVRKFNLRGVEVATGDSGAVRRVGEPPEDALEALDPLLSTPPPPASCRSFRPQLPAENAGLVHRLAYRAPSPAMCPRRGLPAS